MLVLLLCPAWAFDLEPVKPPSTRHLDVGLLPVASRAWLAIALAALFPDTVYTVYCGAAAGGG